MSDVVSVELAAWLGCLAFVVMLVKNGSELLDRWLDRAKTKPEPAGHYQTISACEARQRELRARLDAVDEHRANWASRQDIASLSASLQDLRKDIGGRLDADKKETTVSRAMIHKRMNAISTALAMVIGRLEQATGIKTQAAEVLQHDASETY